MIALLALPALAGPPRAEVLAGWSGNGDVAYSYATFQPTLFHSGRWRLLARGTFSHLHTSDAEAPGVAVGPAVGLGLGDLSLGAGLNLGARRFATEVTFEPALTGEVFWRPGQRASLYTQAALGRTLWLRAGGTVPVTPRDRPVSLWLGFEGTSSGPVHGLTHEVAPVAEVPVGPLRASLGFRVAVPIADLSWRRATPGVTLYWAL